ncbi:MAG TPA: aminomethyl-transferring glycine dehydrogenase [Pseudomonadales bacterium]
MSSRSPQVSIRTLAQKDDFISRHIGPSGDEQQAMLGSLGVDSLDTLIRQTVPAKILLEQTMNLAEPLSETEALAKLAAMADGNTALRSLIGMGYADTITPNVITRNVLENPGWYTAYTPYQPEVAQGRLEALLNFQQMVMDLTALDLANASLLDEGTAAAEAMTLCKRANRRNRSDVFFVADDVHPQTLAVVKTRARYLGFEIVTGNATDAATTDAFGALLQYPGTLGDVIDYRELIGTLKSRDTHAVMAADFMSLLLLTPPGELGADIAIGNTQRFGVPMGFGGPHAAYMATRDEHKRSVPGRIIGVSIDRRGNTALRMAMQTREQHIRREKATSNICTAQALLAIMAVSYAIYHGPERLRTIATRIQRLTALFADALKTAGFTPVNTHYFDTLTVQVDDQQARLMAAALQAGFNLRAVGTDRIGISLDEVSSIEEIRQLLGAFGIQTTVADLEARDRTLEAGHGIPASLQRQSTYLTHPVFNSHHSETAMLRYLKQLEDRDVALNRSMIALGSCTMKLNATAEMIPVTWPAFAKLHPFAPIEQAQGYKQLTEQLEAMLVACTGYDAVSLQPNAGSQGEYAGLLAIRRYHESRNEGHRDVCLIPSSAHGTNPASAALLGMKIVVVNCDDNGNVDLDDLKMKAERHRQDLAAIMVTYPSTHGVFEEGITDLCRIVHEHGGQVYVDGANMNALVGVAAPGQFGADVSHLNLHKTFCIPHGGGGPGMGPIAMKAHLAPFACDNPIQPDKRSTGEIDVVSSATWGSASILPISWMYIALMGARGLRSATEVAILNANYVANRLKDHYPVLYTGRNGRVAHECILDMRPIKETSGISEEDVAKRLIDFGFHAPTMSFPVPGTLMVEPTESESKAELDRFCDAMIQIRNEIRKVEDGAWPLDNNPLVNAPHTLADITHEWAHPYSREEACFALPWVKAHKYWPAVNRVDNVYGDRNLFCACPPMESYQS